LRVKEKHIKTVKKLTRCQLRELIGSFGSIGNNMTVYFYKDIGYNIYAKKWLRMLVPLVEI